MGKKNLQLTLQTEWFFLEKLAAGRLIFRCSSNTALCSVPATTRDFLVPLPWLSLSQGVTGSLLLLRLLHTPLYMFARAAVSKYHRLGCLNRNLFSRRSGGWKSQVRVSAGLVPPEASFLVLHASAFWPCPHMVSPPSSRIPSVSLCKFPFLKRTTVRLDYSPS